MKKIILVILLLVFMQGCSTPLGYLSGDADINGTADAEQLAGYKINYRLQDSDNWTSFGVMIGNNSQKVVEGVLANLNSSELNEGEYELRLVVSDTSNASSDDYVYFSVDNSLITYPYYYDYISNRDYLTVNGTAAGRGFVNYSLRYRNITFDYNTYRYVYDNWTTMHTSNRSVIRGLLYNWYIGNLSTGDYDLELLVDYNNELKGYDFVPFYIYNPTILTNPNTTTQTTVYVGGGGSSGGGGGGSSYSGSGSSDYGRYTETINYRTINAGSRYAVSTRNRYLDITGLSLLTKGNYNDGFIKITEYFYLPSGVVATDRVAYSYFDIEHLQIPNKDIAASNITFRVPIEWLARYTILPDSVGLQRYTGSYWQDLKTDITGLDINYYYYNAASLELSTFAITYKQPVYVYQQETTAIGEQQIRETVIQQVQDVRQGTIGLVDKLVYIVPIAMLVIVVILILVGRKKKNPLAALTKAVNAARKKGFKDGEIAKEAMNSGWPEETINRTLKESKAYKD